MLMINTLFMSHIRITMHACCAVHVSTDASHQAVQQNLAAELSRTHHVLPGTPTHPAYAVGPASPHHTLVTHVQTGVCTSCAAAARLLSSEGAAGCSTNYGADGGTSCWCEGVTLDLLLLLLLALLRSPCFSCLTCCCCCCPLCCFPGLLLE